MTHALLIYNAMLLDESTDTPGAVLSVDGKIRSVFNGYFTNANTVSSMAKAVLLEDGYSDDCTLELFDAAGLTLTPAFIDMHVHLRYPGQPLKEDLESGTHACASGGFGTICAMPNTNPVVSSKEQAGAIMNEAKQLGYTNVIQVVSITKDFEGKDISHIDELDPARTPVISEDGREVASSEVMLNAMEKAARKGLIVACHCEDPELAAMAKPFRQHGLKTLKENNIPLDPLKIHEIGEVPSDVSESIRDDFMNANELLRTAEDTLTQRNIALAELAHAKVHLCHVSTELSIDYVRQAKKRGYTNISCEVTPHHICCSAYDWKEMLAIVNPHSFPTRRSSDLLTHRKTKKAEVLVLQELNFLMLHVTQTWYAQNRFQPENFHNLCRQILPASWVLTKGFSARIMMRTLQLWILNFSGKLIQVFSIQKESGPRLQAAHLLERFVLYS